ncbi:MAG: FG-GAP repeat domain-containing protein [Thermoplasmatota archaeon]
MDLRLNDWGNHVGSMHIEPGHTIRFTVNARDGSPARESCWFTHPAGVEQCAAPPPPPPTSTWPAKDMGYAGVFSYSGDMAIGDADNDGAKEVYSASDTGVFQFKWTGSSWTSQRLGSLSQMTALAVGDGDGDGFAEVYVMTNGAFTSSNLVRYSWVNNAWTEATLLTLPGGARDMTVANIDGQPGSEIYVGLDDGNSAAIYQLRFNGRWWDSPSIATMPGHLESLWVGDGDRDGSYELYVGHGTDSGDSTAGTAKTSRLRPVAESWEFLTIDQIASGVGKQYVVAGDGDRDGKAEVYSITVDGKFRSVTFNPSTGWSAQTLMDFSGDGASGLFLGDGDGDGSQELYVPTYRGQLFQVRWSGTTWVRNHVAGPMDSSGNTGDSAMLVVGDGDNDGTREVYLGVGYSGSFPDPGHIQVYQVVAPRSSGFDATFTGVRGNEWWEQATVTASGGTISKADLRLNDGAWQPLTKQSWGGYAASYRAVQGTIVQFRATSTTGATDLSDCYRWIPASNTDATKVTCGTSPPPPPPPPAGFDATFSAVKGNNWWVEAKVTGNQPIAKVEARVNCGTTWQTLTLQNWGSYAKSFNIPNGAKVDFRATSGSSTDLSAGYIWPQATPTTGCP